MLKMCRGRYQPLLLIYQLSETTPLNTTTAIKKSFKIEDFLFSFRNVQSAMVPLGKFLDAQNTGLKVVSTNSAGRSIECSVGHGIEHSLTQCWTQCWLNMYVVLNPVLNAVVNAVMIVMLTKVLNGVLEY